MSMIEQIVMMERDQVIGFFLSPGSRFSIIALLVSLIATLYYLRKRPKAQNLSSLADLRHLLTDGLPHHKASHRLDIAYFLISLFVSAFFLTGAVLSFDWVAQTVYSSFGSRPAPLASVPPWMAMAIATVALALVFEWSYWLYHWLCHKAPWLWQFHKLHHTAESLSIFTVFRVHPIEVILNYNMLALFSGATTAALWLLFGRDAMPLSLYGTNVLLLVSSILVGNLQHCQLWLHPPGWLGKVILGPAHHLIHHSADPEHHDRNLGNLLSFFDRRFGTYFEPPLERPALNLGIGEPTSHRLIPSLVSPFFAFLPRGSKPSQNPPLKSGA